MKETLEELIARRGTELQRSYDAAQAESARLLTEIKEKQKALDAANLRIRHIYQRALDQGVEKILW